jgi:hypothetical protein
MVTVLHTKVKTARKVYSCAASEWIVNACSLSELMDNYKMPFSDRRKLAKMHQERYRINVGDKYLEQVQVYDGEFSCLQCRLDAVEICEKYRLYDED